MTTLDTKIESLGGIYKRYARSLEKLGITKLGDFLYHVPFRYIDYSLISKIDKLQPGETATVKGRVKKIDNQYLRNHRTIQKATIEDDTGEIEVVWFNQPFLAKNITEGEQISVAGKISEDRYKTTIKSPDYEITDNETIHTGRLVPVYRETRGISSKWIRRQTYKLLKETNEIIDFLPEDIKVKENLMDLPDALAKIHFPEFINQSEEARVRLSFDEFLLMQTRSLMFKKKWGEKIKGIKFEQKKFNKDIEELINSLPFELTAAQNKATQEIFADVSSGKSMNRLLEGDVGSGKTVVAIIVAYLAYLNGYKALLIAPTEILANQHFQTFDKLLKKFNLKIALATGKKKINLENFDVLIGTHAVLSKKIKTENLGLVVVDEQQRFGVEQRGLLREKGENPHLLTMTATPIPRTVALTMYGNLDLSVLDELPKGRKEIKTWLVPKTKREAAYTWIEKEIKESKSQTFIICPFIEESESMTTVKAATKEFDFLKKEVFKNLRLGLLHGKQKVKERDEILEKFKEGKIDILVATPVVEVGIDIPNATIIVIEAAERFGLAQLHQLRGRVGRGEKQSYCLLFSESETATSRLKYMEQTQIGAKLAELDLKLRGPGEIYGTSQHGVPFLKVASFSDFELIEKTKKTAKELMDNPNKYEAFFSKLEGEETNKIVPD